MATVQGFLASITIDGSEVTTVVENFTLSETRGANDKQTMNGSPDGVKIPGSRSGSLSFDFTIDQAELNVLEAAWAKDEPVAFQIAIVEAGVGTNTVWDGFLSLTDFSKETVGDGIWRGSMAGDTSGAITHTPFVA